MQIDLSKYVTRICIRLLLDLKVSIEIIAYQSIHFPLFIYLFMFFFSEKTMAWHFMWIVCYVEEKTGKVNIKGYNWKTKSAGVVILEHETVQSYSIILPSIIKMLILTSLMVVPMVDVSTRTNERTKRTDGNLYADATKTNKTTIDSRYLEVQGTFWNTSRYLYQVCRIEQKINRATTFHKLFCNLTPEVRDVLKILWKRGEIAP